jgi:IS605 OrfB family transposase
MALKKEKGHFQINESILATVETATPDYVKLTQLLFNDCVIFYVSQMSSNLQLFLNTSTEKLYNVYEKLITCEPILNAARIPQDLRRAAIKKAAGVVKSWHSNFERWMKRIERAKTCHTLKKRTRLKKKAGKPPILPQSTNFPIQVYSGMFKNDTGDSLVVKLWTGKTWQYQKVSYKCRELPPDYVKGTFSLIYDENVLKLVWVIQKNTPSRETLIDHIKAYGKLRILSIDLNLDDPIVVGKVLEGYEDTSVVVELANLRLCGNNRLHYLRKRYLGRIAKAKSLTNTKTELGVLPPENLCANLWKRIKSLEKQLIETISHLIVENANVHNCNVIVFENLKSLKPQRGKYSRRSNMKRSFWVAKKIQKRVEQKALNRYSIYTVRVNPAYTSITDSRSGAKCLRGSQVGSLNLYLWSDSGNGKLVQTPNGKILCSGENAARNIGLKYLAAKFEKPVVFKNAGLLTGCVVWLPEPVGKGKVVIPAWSCL